MTGRLRTLDGRALNVEHVGLRGLMRYLLAHIGRNR